MQQSCGGSMYTKFYMHRNIYDGFFNSSLYFSNYISALHFDGMPYIYIYIYIYIYHHHHHHHIMPPARISLTLSGHFPLSFIAFGRSSGLHPVSSHSCCMYVLVGRPALARPYVGVHSSTSLKSSSLLPQQCHACLVRLTWIVFVTGGKWPYSWSFVGCCRKNMFNCCLASSPAV